MYIIFYHKPNIWVNLDKITMLMRDTTSFIHKPTPSKHKRKSSITKLSTQNSIVAELVLQLDSFVVCDLYVSVLIYMLFCV